MPVERLFFYVDFTRILVLGCQSNVTGIEEQYQYILRNESMHGNVNVNIDLIVMIKQEETAALLRRLYTG